MESIGNYPLLTVYEVRRMAQAVHQTHLTATRRFTENEASWSGFFHMHNRRRGKVWLMYGSLHANGNDREFTLDREVRADFAIYRDKGMPPFRMSYRVWESARGITYNLVRFAGQVHDRGIDHHYDFSYPYKISRYHPNQPTTRSQLIWTPTNDNLQRFMLNEDLTDGVLKDSGAINKLTI